MDLFIPNARSTGYSIPSISSQHEENAFPGNPGIPLREKRITAATKSIFDRTDDFIEAGADNLDIFCLSACAIVSWNCGLNGFLASIPLIIGSLHYGYEKRVLRKF